MAAGIKDLYERRWSALNITPQLLHRFAQQHNWDEGRDLLVRCIRHPQCSLATALLIYWLGKPHYYRQYTRRAEVADHERADFDLLSAIERRVKSGAFELNDITFDPRRFKGTDWTTSELTYPKLEKKRDIPGYMQIAVTRKGAMPLAPAG